MKEKGWLLLAGSGIELRINWMQAKGTDHLSWRSYLAEVHIARNLNQLFGVDCITDAEKNGLCHGVAWDDEARAGGDLGI
jgi:hypothetical protein